MHCGILFSLMTADHGHVFRCVGTPVAVVSVSKGVKWTTDDLVRYV